MNAPQLPIAKQIMTTKVAVLSPAMSILEAAQILLDKGISGAPVVDESGTLVGLLSEFDCMKDLAAGEYHQDHDTVNIVSDLMTADVLCMDPETDIYTLAQKMVGERVRRLVIRSGTGPVLGIVSRRDVFQALYKYYRSMDKGGKTYPDYPEARKPIKDYPSE